MTNPPRCLLAVNGDVTYLAAEKVTQLRSSAAAVPAVSTRGVYILRNPFTDRVKIGHSGDMRSRWRELETVPLDR